MAARVKIKTSHNIPIFIYSTLKTIILWSFTAFINSYYTIIYFKITMSNPRNTSTRYACKNK